MKEIKVNIPTDFTIEHYQKLGQFEHLSEFEKIIRIISAVSGHEEDFIKSWDLSSINKIYNDLQDKITNVQHVFLPIFEFKGIEYGIQPVSKMTGAEYIDLESRLKTGDILEVVSILYRPIVSHKFDSMQWKLRNGIKHIQGKAENLFKYYTVEEYDVEKREWRKDIFKELPVSIALGAYNFFLLIGIQSSNDFLQSSQTLTEKEKMMWQKKVERLLQSTGVGSIPSTPLRKMGESSD